MPPLSGGGAADTPGDSRSKVGVLAVQGGFEAHCEAVRELGAEAREVRKPEELAGVEALILPGGESTTVAMAMEASGLGAAIVDWSERGGPILATCAGMILVGRDQLGLIDIETRRNAFGRQLASFETDLAVPTLGPEPMRAVFIRAPWAEELGPSVEVLAMYDGHAVAVEQGKVTAVAFHPELTDDRRLHQRLLDRM